MAMGSSTPAGSPCQSARHCSVYSDISSLEEDFSDLDLEPCGCTVAWVKHSSAGAGRGRGQSSRRKGCSEHNRAVNYTPSGALDPERCACELCSGPVCDGQVGPDTYGDTSSDSSYSTVPQHYLQHDSPQSEDNEDNDDNDKGRDSKSDSVLQDTGTLRARPAKGINGMMNPMLPPSLEKDPFQDANPSEGRSAGSPSFMELAAALEPMLVTPGEEQEEVSTPPISSHLTQDAAQAGEVSSILPSSHHPSPPPLLHPSRSLRVPTRAPSATPSPGLLLTPTTTTTAPSRSASSTTLTSLPNIGCGLPPVVRPKATSGPHVMAMLPVTSNPRVTSVHWSYCRGGLMAGRGGIRKGGRLFPMPKQPAPLPLPRLLMPVYRPTYPTNAQAHMNRPRHTCADTRSFAARQPRFPEPGVHSPTTAAAHSAFTTRPRLRGLSEHLLAAQPGYNRTKIPTNNRFFAPVFPILPRGWVSPPRPRYSQPQRFLVPLQPNQPSHTGPQAADANQ